MVEDFESTVTALANDRQQPTESLLWWELLSSFRELILSLATVCRAIASACWTVARIIGRTLKSPKAHRYLKQSVAATYNGICSICLWFFAASIPTKIAVLSTALILYGLWSGQVTAKSLRKLKRKLSKRMASAYDVTVEVVTTLLPMFAVAVPLRYYLSRQLYRRLSNAMTCLVPLWFSSRALSIYYRSRKNIKLTSSDIRNAIAAPRNMSDCLKSEIRSAPTNRWSIATVIHSTAGKDEEDRLDSTKSLPIWLEYWVAASVYDLLICVPFYVLKVIFRACGGFSSFQYGFVDETESIVPIYVSNPSAFTTSARMFAFEALFFSYDVFYMLLLIFVATKRHQRVTAARRWLGWVVNKSSVWLVGVSLPTARTTDTPQATGILPALWSFCRSNLPPTAVVTIDMLAHVPQSILLMFPPIFIPFFVCFVGDVYPAIASMRALETRDKNSQAYWLSYFVLRITGEALAMRWIRKIPIWQWMPGTSHLELVFITAVQLLSISPLWLAEVFLQTPSKPILASTVQVKEEEVPQDSPPRSGPRNKRLRDVSGEFAGRGSTRTINRRASEITQSRGRQTSQKVRKMNTEEYNSAEGKQKRKSQFVPVAALCNSESTAPVPTISATHSAPVTPQSNTDLSEPKRSRSRVRRTESSDTVTPPDVSALGDADVPEDQNKRPHRLPPQPRPRRRTRRGIDATAF